MPHLKPEPMYVTRSKCRLALTLLLSLSVLSGCAHDYLITLDNGDQVLSLSKPKRHGDHYRFTGDDGVGCVIPEKRVLKVRAVSLPQEEHAPPTPTAPQRPRHWYLLWLA